MPAPRLDSPIQYVKGVGPRRAAQFASLGILTVGDLLQYFPFRYEAELGQVEIADLQLGMTATVQGEVTRVAGRYPGFRAEIDDGSGACTLRWFQAPRGGLGIYLGATVVATGRVQEYDGALELIQPSIRVFKPDTVMMNAGGASRQTGVYRGNQQIKSPTVRRAVQSVLAQGRLAVEEILPAALARRHGLPAREPAIRHMHEPPDEQALAQARKRLAYEEFLLLELAMAIRRHHNVALQVGRKLPAPREVDQRIRARFPFALTAAQDKAIQEIVRDLESGRPMTRLLQGDVGSGKTVVALYACLAAIANRRQAAIMAPTEILAAQHFANIEAYLAGSRVRWALLRGRLAKKQRADALAQIEAGEIDLIVGTQALLQRDVAFRDLALVVVDEQHKFGVLQRADLRTKGPMPHYLVMTATPIPRTLAMTVFGDLDVSIIDAMPPGRGKIITKVVTRRQWPTVMDYVRGRLERGEQAYVVCPLIGSEEGTRDRRDEGTEGGTKARRHEGTKGAGREGGGRASTGGGTAGVAPEHLAPGLVSAKTAFELLTRGPWEGLRVGLLHGSQKSAEKQATIETFAAGELHAIVATTVVEVGVDVANATIMIVENADRFGLSQLHQLRGRVGRGAKDSLCVLIARSRGEKAAQRLSVMAETTDGFKIAEADLRQRGPGELFGTRQHGLPELRVGSIVDDFGLLEQARRDAFAMIASDPKLARPEHATLIPALRRLFGGKLALIDAG